MKLKKKILASVLAVVIGLGVIGLPNLGALVSKAYSVASTQFTLEVKNVEKTYDVVTANKIVFKDYSETINAQVELRNPDGSVLYAGPVTSNLGASQINHDAEFRNPGLYAMQFKLQSDGIFIYSDVIYIPVSNSNAGAIKLDGTLNSKVAPGTSVVIPMPISADWSEDTSTTIKVFTPYGEEIEATKSSVTNKWTFTNKADVLGKYFVEYTKKVMMGRYEQTYYKYETIEFSEESTNTTSTKNFEKTEETTTTEPKIVVSNMEVTKDDYIYIYKRYNINNVYVTRADGSTDNDANIFVSIFDANLNKYYNFTTSAFDLETEAEAKKNINEVSEFSLTNISNLASFSATGHEIKLTYTAVSGATEIAPQYVVKTEKFNTSDIKINPVSLVQSEVTNINLVEEVDEYDINVVNFPSVEVTANGNYNLDAIKNLITAVRLTLSPDTGVSIQTNENNNSVDENGVGLVFSGDNVLNRTFSYHYNKHMTEEIRYQVIYAVDLKLGDTSSTSLTTSGIYTYFRAESKDKTAPSNLTIGSYNLFITDGKFTIPTATVTDKDDLGNITSGARIDATISGGQFANEYISMGRELTDLENGTYTVTYTATDYKSNSRVKTINFIVDGNRDQMPPALEQCIVDISIDEGTVSVTTNLSADYVVIYGGEKGYFNPTKTSYVDGRLVGFEFEAEAIYSYIAVFAKTNTYSTIYSAAKIIGGQFSIMDTFRSFGYDKATSGYTLIKPNTTVETNVMANLLWFGSKDMVIDAPENGSYTVRSGNIFRFFVAGTYTIRSTEDVIINGETIKTSATTTIVVKNSMTAISATQPIGNKVIGEKGKAVVLNYPVATNFFGYKLDVVIKDSAGNIVNNAIKNNGINISFVPPADDVYTINYTFRADDITKGEVVVKYTTGNIALPKITITSENQNEVWKGETIKYELAGAIAVDKNGKAVTVSTKVFDQYGKELKVLTEDDSQYVELTGAGFYTVYYTAVDEFGKESVANTTFAVEFPEESENDGPSAWGVVGIIFGSVAGACAIALLIMYLIKRKKNSTRFINKTRENKKQEKRETITNSCIYTIAESKDEKYWILKSGNRTIAKLTSKQEAIDKAKEVHKKGEQVIKVYNKNGRLIDSL